MGEKLNERITGLGDTDIEEEKSEVTNKEGISRFQFGVSKYHSPLKESYHLREMADSRSRTGIVYDALEASFYAREQKRYERL